MDIYLVLNLMFEQALIFGMTPDQFWLGDPDLYYIYQSAHIEKQKYDNMLAWLSGKYVLDAVQQAVQFSKNPKEIYPKKPYSLDGREKEQYKKEVIENTKIMVASFKKLLKNKNKNKNKK